MDARPAFELADVFRHHGETYKRANAEPPGRVERRVMAAIADQFDGLPFLRFDDEAQGEFGEWRADLETRIRAADMAPALESHLAKYRKLAPALALINHLADSGAGPIGRKRSFGAWRSPNTSKPTRAAPTGRA